MSVWLGLLLVLTGIALVVGYRIVERLNKKPMDFPYIRRTTLYDRAERRFLGYLVKAVGEQYFIMGKVRVADLIAIESRLSEKQRRDAYQNICHERVDFVLTDRATTRLVAAIELYQNKPNDARLIKRAQNLDKVFKLAGLPLIRFQENDVYRVADIRHAIASSVADQQIADKSVQAARVNPIIPSVNKPVAESIPAKEFNTGVIA